MCDQSKREPPRWQLLYVVGPHTGGGRTKSRSVSHYNSEALPRVGRSDSPQFFGHRRQTSMTRATVHGRFRPNPSYEMSSGWWEIFHGVSGLCTNSLAHGLPGGIQAQNMRRAADAGLVFCSAGRTTACDPHYLGGDQRGDRGPVLLATLTRFLDSRALDHPFAGCLASLFLLRLNQTERVVPKETRVDENILNVDEGHGLDMVAARARREDGVRLTKRPTHPHDTVFSCIFFAQNNWIDIHSLSRRAKHSARLATVATDVSNASVYLSNAADVCWVVGRVTSFSFVTMSEALI